MELAVSVNDKIDGHVEHAKVADISVISILVMQQYEEKMRIFWLYNEAETFFFFFF